jgi:hypothetical protein
MAVGIAELIGATMSNVAIDPADLEAGALQRRNAPLQRLRAAGAEGRMPKPRCL